MRPQRGYNIGEKMKRIPQVKMKGLPGKVISVSKGEPTCPGAWNFSGFSNRNPVLQEISVLSKPGQWASL